MASYKPINLFRLILRIVFYVKWSNFQNPDCNFPKLSDFLKNHYIIMVVKCNEKLD